MKKRIISLFLAFVTLLGILPVTSLAAPTLEEAMAEVNVYARNETLNWLTMNGSVKEQHYTYYNFRSEQTGQVREIPAYCVDPRLYGVPALVPEGTPIKYTAPDTVSDPKVCGIIANGYPHEPLSALKLNTPEEAYYATKTALWMYLLGNWSVNGLGINPNADQAAAQRVLEAAKAIYTRGMGWNHIPSPKFTATADRDVAYPVTINGQPYYQQIITISSDTWTYQKVKLSLADGAPAGARILDMNDQEISELTMSTYTFADGHKGQCKIVYPASSVEGQTGTVQLNMNTVVVQYQIYYAKSLQTDQYGNIQDYMLDTDPYLPMEGSFISRYSAEPDVPDGPDDPPSSSETGIKVIKLEAGTQNPLEGAVFKVTGPDGTTVGSFSTREDGTFTVPVTQTGHYTVEELSPPRWHLVSDNATQHVQAVHGKIAEVTFYNDPYGDLRVEKYSNTGDPLKGVTVQIKHIATGETKSGQTGPGGAAQFTGLKPGGWEIQETAGIEGWIADTDTVQTVSVVSGETSTVTLTNKELPGLRIIKYDRKNMALMSKVTFAVYRDGEFLGNFQTDEFGEILITDARPGTYRAFEVDTGSDGHILDTTPQEVELHAGDGIKELLFFNDVKPGIHLIKVDSADPSKVIPNAVFEIKSVKGDYGPEEFRTNQDGEIDLSKLPAGAYVVTEKACEGYIIDEAQRIIQLDGNEDAEFVFTNTIRPSIQIVKRSSDGTPLGGVHFRIAKIEDGSHYLDRVTDRNGEINISDLEPGVYSIRETATTSDHIIDLREYHVELFPGKTSTLTVENQKRPNLYVYKNDADDGTPIKDTVFLVKAADGHSVDEIKADSEGKATLSNLLPGVYEISEKSVPSPYLQDADPQLVTLYPNRDRKVYFENHKRPVIEIIKENEVTYERLANVPFRVSYGSNNTSTGEINDLGVFYTDENGRIELNGPEMGDLGLRDAWFRVQELEPLKGFAKADPDTQEAFVPAGQSHTFRFRNRPLSAICVWKYDSQHPNVAIEGAVFQVKYLSGNTSGTGGTVIGTYRTSANGSFTVTGLKKGTYIIEELSSDGSHVIDTPPQTVYLSGEEQEVVQVYFGNSAKGAVLIKKISASDHAPLSDVEFFITDSHGTMLGDANGKFVTDSAGTILISNLDPGTTIVARETRAKDNYILDDVPQTATVKAGQTVSLEFRNQPKGSVTIYKFSSVDRKTPLEGVGFKITYADGRVVDNIGGKLSSNGIYYTNSEGQINISGVTGTLICTETSSIPGYLIDENRKSQTIVVNPDDHQSVYFYNIPENTLIIEKYLETESGNEPLKGVTFLVTDSSGAVIGNSNGEFITGEDGRVVIAGVAPGTTVTAREIKVPEGVVLDSTPKSIKIGDDGANTLRFYNKKTGYLVIRKLDKISKEPLANVEFELTYADGSYVDDNFGHLSSKGRFKTNDAGEIRVPVVGTVVVKEVKTLSTHVIDQATQIQTVTVNPADTQTLVVYNEPLCSLTLRKVDATNGKPIPNTEFTLKDGNGTVLGSYTTGADGTVTVTGLMPNSTIVVVESKVPSNYVLDPTPRTIIVRNGSNSVASGGTGNSGNVSGGNTGTAGGGNDLTVENIPKTTLTIEKYLETDAGNVPLKGVTFLVTDASGAVLGPNNGEYTSDENGRIVIPNLEPGTVITAKEIRVPDGVVLDPTPKSIEIKGGIGGQTLTFINKAYSGILIHKIDSATKQGIYGVTFLLYDASKNPIGQYTSNDKGYVHIDNLPGSGRYYLRELENDGYLVDTQLKTVYVTDGTTTEITWENTAITGQIQITKTSEDYNSMNGWPAGTPIPGTEFEIYHYRTGNLVDTVRTDKNGVAVSKPLPLGRYKVVESKAADFYGLDKTPIEVEIEHAGQIVKTAITNKALYTNVSIKKTGFVEVMPGQQIRYDFSGIANNSTTALTSFYWRDTLPTQAVRLDKIVTGTYNVQGNYKIVFKTNLNGEYRTMYDNLNTQQNNVLDASPAALGLASNEYVTEFMLSFGVVPGNFRQVEAPRVYCNVVSWLTGGTQFVNQADVGGVYNGQWIMATSRWVTRVYRPAAPLPRTGY